MSIHLAMKTVPLAPPLTDPPYALAPSEPAPLAADFLAALQRADSVAQACRLGLAEVQRLTGFSRGLVWRFGDEGAGDLVAGAVDEWDRPGPQASVSVKLLVGGRPWGQLRCHDRTPHRLDAPVLQACEHAGQLLSLRVQAIEERAQAQDRWTEQLRSRDSSVDVALRRADEMAEVASELGRINKELETFSTTVSHDLRAPMRHIASFIELVLDREGETLSPASRRHLAHAKEASGHAGRLLEALLDFSRMGHSVLRSVSINTEHLLDGLIAEQQVQGEERRIEWRVQRPLPALWGDPVLLQVAVRNLIANAVKYTRTRDVARIEISGIDDAHGTGLSVWDNGVGFRMTDASRLFGVFQRLHGAEAFEGTGIGLASVRRIVERHGGRVDAWGEPGHGARFGFTLPTRAMLAMSAIVR